MWFQPPMARSQAPCSAWALATMARLSAGALAKALPEGDWHFGNSPANPALTVLAVKLGGYRFHAVRQETRANRFALPCLPVSLPLKSTASPTRVFLARDLVNTPANDMGPDGSRKPRDAAPRRTRRRSP